MSHPLQGIDFFQLESGIWIAERKTQVAAYDFQFVPLFSISRPREASCSDVIARIGAIADYENFYRICLEENFKLINTPEEHQRAENLTHWYPLVEQFTPYSRVYEQFPSLEEVMQHFEFPIFIKGTRQTSKHRPDLSIAHTVDDFIRIREAYANDPILHWQAVVCRSYIQLRSLPVSAPDKVPLSYEFRTFWLHGKLIGAGHYWSQYHTYQWTPDEERNALNLAKAVVDQLQVPFLVVDLAQTATGHWMMIECNDGQESGYCGVPPIQLWQEVLTITS